MRIPKIGDRVELSGYSSGIVTDVKINTEHCSAFISVKTLDRGTARWWINLYTLMGYNDDDDWRYLPSFKDYFLRINS